MTQLEDDDLFNNLLKIPGTIIIYNNDMSSYDYVLNAHNVTLPPTPATSSAGSAASEQSVDDLNSSASIDTDLAASSPAYQLPLLQPDSPASIVMMETLDTAPGSSELDHSFGAFGAGQAPGAGELEPDEDGGDIIEEEEEEEEEDLTGPAANGGGGDDDDSEPELTNLSWLTELKNITNLTPSDVPLTDLPTARFNKFIAQVRRSRETYDKRKDQYTSLANAQEKPPFNYAQIIAMAMLEEGRMTLKQICKWIQEKFSYYKVHKNWNNSIRHNLSLSFFFTKVQRAKDEKGKGGYWELSMDVSKSERRRIRVRQRNKSTHSGSLLGAVSRRSMPAPRLPKGGTPPSSASSNPSPGGGGGVGVNNNNNDQTINNNLTPKYHHHGPVGSSDEVLQEEISITTAPPPPPPPPPSSVTVSYSTAGEPQEVTLALDSNNNRCQLPSILTVPLQPLVSSETVGRSVQSVTIDIIDNYGSKPAVMDMDTVLHTPNGDPSASADPRGGQEMPHTVTELDVSEQDHLIQAGALPENCPISFDSIINGEGSASIFNNLNVDEIFSDNEIPQPANDDIIVPFFSNVQQVQTGPNVVVETIPYYLPDMGTFDESDFGNLININEQEISDEFLNEHGFL